MQFFAVFLASIKKRTGKISRIQGKAHMTGVKLKNLRFLPSTHNNDGNRLFINQTAKEKFHHDVYHQDIILSVKGKIANVISFLCIWIPFFIVDAPVVCDRSPFNFSLEALLVHSILSDFHINVSLLWYIACLFCCLLFIVFILFLIYFEQ